MTIKTPRHFLKTSLNGEAIICLEVPRDCTEGNRKEKKKKKHEQVDSLNIEFLSCLTERCYLLSFIQTINYLAKCCPDCGVIAMN